MVRPSQSSTSRESFIFWWNNSPYSMSLVGLLHLSITTTDIITENYTVLNSPQPGHSAKYQSSLRFPEKTQWEKTCNDMAAQHWWIWSRNFHNECSWNSFTDQVNKETTRLSGTYERARDAFWRCLALRSSNRQHQLRIPVMGLTSRTLLQECKRFPTSSLPHSFCTY